MEVCTMNEKTNGKTMPVGVDDFAKIIQGGYSFIDKTRFIKEILDGHSG
ncbi:MAG: AAA family ATPase, partial [Selenomonadaceae bacterium]|nr:AAA family ATPase [Selenomonadaceae bacterium]